MIAIGDGKRRALFIYIVCVFKGCPLFLKVVLIFGPCLFGLVFFNYSSLISILRIKTLFNQRELF